MQQGKGPPDPGRHSLYICWRLREGKPPPALSPSWGRQLPAQCGSRGDGLGAKTWAIAPPGGCSTTLQQEAFPHWLGQHPPRPPCAMHWGWIRAHEVVGGGSWAGWSPAMNPNAQHRRESREDLGSQQKQFQVGQGSREVQMWTGACSLTSGAGRWWRPGHEMQA